MKRSAWWVVGSVVAMAVTASPAMAEIKIGFVAWSKLMQSAPQAAGATARLEAEYGARQKEILAQKTALEAKADKYQKDKDTMSADQRTRAERELTDNQRDLQQKVNNFQEDYNKSSEMESQRVQGELVQEVNGFARDNKFDLIVVDGVVYASNNVDVTDAVLALLKTKYASAPAAAKPADKAPAAKPADKPAAGGKK